MVRQGSKAATLRFRIALRELDGEQTQGYYYAKPLPAPRFAANWITGGAGAVPSAPTS
jgi:predicted signal transduction protein with EAL and GGDEF domain